MQKKKNPEVHCDFEMMLYQGSERLPSISFLLICYLEICEGLCIYALIGIWMKTDER